MQCCHCARFYTTSPCYFSPSSRLLHFLRISREVLSAMALRKARNARNGGTNHHSAYAFTIFRISSSAKTSIFLVLAQDWIASVRERPHGRFAVVIGSAITCTTRVLLYCIPGSATDALPLLLQLFFKDLLLQIARQCLYPSTSEASDD